MDAINFRHDLVTLPTLARLAIGMAIIVGVPMQFGASAWAAENPFVGRWHLNGAESTAPPGKPRSMDVTADILRADSTHMRWSITIPGAQGQQPDVETFDVPANGEFYSISGDTTAAFRLSGSSVQATFKGPAGQTDAQTCTLTSDRRKMTCKGMLSDGRGRTADYVDVYDRI
jgi:hypothetical protein